MFDQVLWFATRGAGAVSLLMFTAATCLGLVTVTRFQASGWPRFFNYELHRRVSLLSMVFLAVHVLAAVLDPFTSLGIGAALVPLASTYRPIPVALGVIALYLVVALIATSLLRKRLGQRTWRVVHWSSYAMWPLAVLHGLTAGTDGWSRWMLAIDAVSVVAVALCLVWRVAVGSPNRARLAEVVATPSLQSAPRPRDAR
jgi:methionine sulfoxide reductase heme-binding subunit